MMRLHAVLMLLLISLIPLTTLHPHCLLFSLIPPSPLHPLASLPCLHGGRVDLSGHLYDEVFLGYEILYGQVSLE
jgi:hypothetical protein